MTEVLEKTNWRTQAKNLGIPLNKETGGSRKKVDVLAEIESCYKEDYMEPEIVETVEINVLPESETTIEPIEEHPKYEWEPGKFTDVVVLMRRIEALENRVNRLIEAIDKSKRVKGI